MPETLSDQFFSVNACKLAYIADKLHTYSFSMSFKCIDT